MNKLNLNIKREEKFFTQSYRRDMTEAKNLVNQLLSLVSKHKWKEALRTIPMLAAFSKSFGGHRDLDPNLLWKVYTIYEDH